MEHQLGRYRRN